MDVEIPDDIADLKISHLRELAESEQLLEGLFDTSSVGKDVYERQKALAENNAERARNLKTKLSDLEETRSRVNAKLKETKDLEQEWYKAENEMYKAIQPFSFHSLQNNLARAIDESDATTTAMSTSFLENMHADSREIADFIKAYRAERRIYHLRKERLQRWKEEQVM